MKAISALYLLKRHGLIHANMRLRDLRFLRCVTECKTWEDLVRWIMLAHYLTGDKDLTDEIRIPEV